MRIIEEIDRFRFKEVKLIRHEARTYNKDFDDKLREFLKDFISTQIFPIGTILDNQRFWYYYIHPKDENKYQQLIKDKIKGIHFIE